MIIPEIEFLKKNRKLLVLGITVNGKRALEINLHKMRNQITQYFIKYENPWGFPGSSDGKESARNVRDPSLILG